MVLTDFGLWRANRSLVPQFRTERDPFVALHRNMGRLLDDFTRGLRAPGPTSWPGAWSHVDVSETEQAVTVVAELPGLAEKDVDLSL
jgi:HSP20 family protein